MSQGLHWGRRLEQILIMVCKMTSLRTWTNKPVFSLPTLCIIAHMCRICVGAAANLNGEGFAFPAGGIGLLLRDFTEEENRFQGQAEVIAEYAVSSSRDGIEALKLGAVDFAVSDVPPSDDDFRSNPTIQALPLFARAVSIIFNLPSVNKLNLSGDHIVGIYNGTYTRWDDPDLQALNNHTQLPAEDIIVLARADLTPTTELFTAALSTFSDTWNQTYGTFRYDDGAAEDTLDWNTTAVTYSTGRSFGMAGVALSLFHSIGYIATCDPEMADNAVAAVYNRAGHVVYPGPDNIRSSTDSIAEQYPWQQGQDILEDMTGNGYPITHVVYIVIEMQNMTHCDNAVRLYRFIQYVMRHNDDRMDLTHRRICKDRGLLPVSTDLLQKINDTLDGFTCDGVSVSLSSQHADHMGASQSSGEGPAVYVSIGAAVALVVIIGSIAAYRTRHRWSLSEMLPDGDCWLDPLSLTALSNTSAVMGSRRLSYYVHSDTVVVTLVGNVKLQYAKYEGTDVMANVLPTNEFRELTGKTDKTIQAMKSEIKQENLCQFYGMVRLEKELCIVVEFCPLGSVYEMLRVGMRDLDDVFRFSICTDIATGLTFLHNKNLVHGKITPHVCYVDAKWTTKIADWQFNALRLSQAAKIRGAHQITSKISDEERIWIAPEMLKHQPPDVYADVFGLAMLVTAVFNGGHPCQLSEDPPTAEIIAAVEVVDHFRFPSVIPGPHAEVIKAGMNILPTARPSASRILAAVQESNSSEKTVMERLYEQLESKTLEIDSTMQKFAKLLHELLPPMAAENLLKGEPVIPESYDSVTLYLSDIVGFTSLSSKSKPIEVVNMLNDLYSSVDSTLDKHDVYKLETIGDAYMAISGLPQRNGKLHASHIANMAIDLSWVSVQFKIRHLPEEPLRLRMGLHTGPVVAGVVGVKMPRFCLFGYTVTNVEVMESTSVPRKVQMSQTTFEYLEELGGFNMKLRTTPNPKVNAKTYWLNGKKGKSDSMPKEFRRDVDGSG